MKNQQLLLTHVLSPAADPQNCEPPPKIDNAVVLTPYQKQYLSNSEVTYQCRPTYSQVRGNVQTIRCVNGNWEESDLTCTCMYIHFTLLSSGRVLVKSFGM